MMATDTEFGDEGMMALAPALGKLAAMTSLDLSGTRLHMWWLDRHGWCVCAARLTQRACVSWLQTTTLVTWVLRLSMDGSCAVLQRACHCLKWITMKVTTHQERPFFASLMCLKSSPRSH